MDYVHATQIVENARPEQKTKKEAKVYRTSGTRSVARQKYSLRISQRIAVFSESLLSLSRCILREKHTPALELRRAPRRKVQSFMSTRQP